MAKAATTQIKSGFLILDVTTGRKQLAKDLAKGNRKRVLIEAEIYDEHGTDDGTSQEFSAYVKSVKLVEAA